MNFYLLDVAGASFLILFPLVILLLLLIWGLAEGFVIYLFGINLFWKSIWHAIIVNLISLVVGLIIVGVATAKDLTEYTSLTTDPDQLPTWTIYFILSVVIEALVLRRLNKSKSWSRIFMASVVMNLVSYIVLYAYAYYYAG